MDMLPDNYESYGEDSQPKKKRWFLQILSTLLGMVVILAVWLFYPVKPSSGPLRGNLPENCFVSLETHLPLELWNQWEEQDYFHQIALLPAWPLVQRSFEQSAGRGLSAEDVAMYVQKIDAVVADVPFAGSLLSLAAGLTSDKKNFAAVAEVDNLGYAAVALWQAFSPAGRDDGKPYISLAVKQRGIEQIYLRLAPVGRRVLVASNLQLLREFNSSSGNVEKTWYAAGHQTPLEMSLRVEKLEDLGLNSRWYRLPDNSRFMPGNFRSSLLLDIDRFSLQIYSEAQFSKKPDIKPLKYSLMQPPADFRGLFLGISASDTGFSRMLSPFFKKNGSGDVYDFVENVLLPYSSERCFFMLRQPPDNSSDPVKLFDYSLMGWTVNNSQQAEESFSSAIKTILEKTSKNKQNDMMISYLLSGMRVSRFKEGKMLTLPLNNPGYYPMWQISQGDDGRDNMVIKSAGSKAELPVSGGLLTKQNVYAQMSLVWKHSPLVLQGIEQLVKQFHGILDISEGMLSPQEIIDYRNALKSLQNFGIVAASMSSLKTECSIYDTGGSFAVEMNSVGSLMLRGR